MIQDSLANGPPYTAKILIPIASYIDRERLAKVLHALSVFQNPLIVLLHVIEVPSRTVPLEPFGQEREIALAHSRLSQTSLWLKEQGYESKTKVVIARSIPEGIVTEANLEGYSAVILMKRRTISIWDRLRHRSVSERVIRSAKCMVITILVEPTPVGF
jgi:nucleotide-binding universal stress UspA family protein